MANERKRKEEKLKMIRSQVNKRKEVKVKSGKVKVKGKDFYLSKVTNFLVTSFFLNLAIEMVYTIGLLHDYINGYLNNQTYVFYDIIEGNNFCFMTFFAFRVIGYVISVRFFMDSIQRDV